MVTFLTWLADIGYALAAFGLSGAAATIMGRIVLRVAETSESPKAIDQPARESRAIRFLERFSAILHLRRRVYNLEDLCVQLLMRCTTLSANDQVLQQSILNLAREAGLQAVFDHSSNKEVN